MPLVNSKPSSHFPTRSETIKLSGKRRKTLRLGNERNFTDFKPTTSLFSIWNKRGDVVTILEGMPFIPIIRHGGSRKMWRIMQISKFTPYSASSKNFVGALCQSENCEIFWINNNYYKTMIIITIFLIILFNFTNMYTI